MREVVQKKRLRYACALIGLLFAALCVAAAVQWVMRLVSSPAMSVPLAAWAEEDWDGPDLAAPSDLPQDIEREVIDLKGFDALRISESVGVYGFESSCSPDELYENLTSEMKQKGWHSLGDPQCCYSSFVKEEGMYRWAFLSCGQVSGRTVAVLRVMAEEDVA